MCASWQRLVAPALRARTMAGSGAGRAFGKIEVDGCQAMGVERNRLESGGVLRQCRDGGRCHRGAGTAACAGAAFAVWVLMRRGVIISGGVARACADRCRLDGCRKMDGGSMNRCVRRQQRRRAQLLRHSRESLQRQREQHQPDDQCFDSRFHAPILAYRNSLGRPVPAPNGTAGKAVSSLFFRQCPARHATLYVLLQLLHRIVQCAT